MRSCKVLSAGQISIHAEEDGLRKSTVRWLAITPVYLRSNPG